MSVQKEVLSKTIWGVEFFMLCDGDSAPAGGGGGAGAERLVQLPRYHLENYFLEEEVWERVFASFAAEEEWMKSHGLIRAKLRELATELVSYATALHVSARVRLEGGNLDAMPKNCHGVGADELVKLMRDKASNEEMRIVGALEGDSIEALACVHFEKLTASIKEDSNEWKVLIPGKPLLVKLAAEAKTPVDRAKRAYLREAWGVEPFAFQDVLDAFEKFRELGM